MSKFDLLVSRFKVLSGKYDDLKSDLRYVKASVKKKYGVDDVESAEAMIREKKSEIRRMSREADDLEDRLLRDLEKVENA